MSRFIATSYNKPCPKCRKKRMHLGICKFCGWKHEKKSEGGR